MDRRQFLKAVGVNSAAVALAGCQGSDSNGTETPGDSMGTDTPGDSMGTDTPEVQLPNEVIVGRPAPIFTSAWPVIWPGLHDDFEENYGVEVGWEIFSGFTPMVGGLLRGSMHFANLAALGWIRAVNEGLPMKGFLGFTSHHPSVLIVPPGTDWSDLEGGTMGIHAPGAAQDVYGPLMVREELGSIDAMEYEYIIGTPNRIEAMRQGTIDCTMGLVANAYGAEIDGTGELLAAPWEYQLLDNTVGQAWVSLANTIEDNPDWYQVFTDGILGSYNWLYETDPQDIVEGIWEYDDYHHVPHQDAWVSALETVQENTLVSQDLSEDRLTNMMDLLTELEFIEEQPSYDTLVTNQFV